MGTDIRYRRLPIRAARPLQAIASDPTAGETGRQIGSTLVVTLVLLIATAHQLVQSVTG